MRVLCVDPNETAREELVERVRVELPDAASAVEAHESIAGTEAFVEAGTVDCLVTEYDLPDGTGVDLAGRLRRTDPDASVFLFTDQPPERIDTSDGDAVVTEYVDKTADAALARIANLVETTVTSGGQVSYPLPDREDERLAILSEFDFDSVELTRSFDRITDLSVRRFDIDSASINVIEQHEQKMLACKGLGPASLLSQRNDSICTFTIASDDRTMTVEDTHEDPRFEDQQEIFDELGFRSYMGAQIRLPSEVTVGTLCVYDDEPRTFSRADREDLRTLADLLADTLVVYRSAHEDDTPDGESDGADVPTGEPGEADTPDDDLSPAEEAFR
jgi:CheY-like chemotaxis protein